MNVGFVVFSFKRKTFTMSMTVNRVENSKILLLDFDNI